MYPTIEQYKDAIRIAEHSLATLSDYEPILKADGEPWFSSGNFAVVFQMKHKQNGKRLALKCFTRHQERREESYRLISQTLKAVKSDYLLQYQYLDHEIWVSDHNNDGAEYPVVAMEWAEGMTLGDYVKQHCSTPNKEILKRLAHNFEVFCAWIIEQPFAHGDLKPDNIMVRNDDTLALVDYDGIYVPTMQGQQAREFGSPIYRHPKRTLHTYDRHIDDFSLLVLLSELRLIAADPSLYNSSLSGESIVAKAGDWQSPNDARILQAMQIQCTNSSDLALVNLQAILRITAQSDAHRVADWRMVVDKTKQLQSPSTQYDDLPELIPYRKGDYWGFCDRNKKIVIECVYDWALPFSEGLAMVTKDEKYGYINKGKKYGFVDKTGKEVIPCIYDFANDFSEGLAQVNKGERYGLFIDKKGAVVIPSYDYAYRFSKGFERFEKDGKYGFIVKTGHVAIPCIYDIALRFSEGLAQVKKGEKYGFVDKTGKEVTPCIYDYANDFSEGLAQVKKGEKYGFVDKTGKEVTPFIYDNAYSFSEGLAQVKKGEKYGFVDKTGKEVIPFIYDNAYSFSEGLARVAKGKYQFERWGYIDKTGAVVISCIYNIADRFSEGLAEVKKYEKYGFIDKTGKEVIPFIYDDARRFSEGLARVQKDKKYGYIDKIGNEVIPCIYDNYYSNVRPCTFSGGLVQVKKGEKLGYIDKRGVEYWED